MQVYRPDTLSWRQQYNPLRGLTVGRLIFLLEAAERGIFSDLQWLYRFIEKRDATIRALVERRMSALNNLNWDIKIKEGVDEGKAKKQQDELKGAYELIDNLKEAINFLALAEFRGFSHLEKHYNADGDVFHLEIVPQWYWARRMPKATWLYNKRAQSTDNGYNIDPRNFIVREVPRAINEVAIICYLRKNLSMKDWDAYVETYGLPSIFIEMPPTAPVTTQPQYQELVDKVVGDMRGVLPPGAKVQAPLSADRGIVSPFKEHIDYQDTQLVLAGTGGKLTMLNDPTGLGSGQSDSHQDTFDEIARAEAKQINEVMNRQFDAAILEQLFPGEEHLVYFCLDSEDAVDVEQYVQNVVALNGAGYFTPADKVAETTGIPVEGANSFDEKRQQDQEDQQQEQQAKNPDETPFAFREPTLRNRALESNATKLVAEAQARELSAVRNRIDAILRIEDIGIMHAKLEALSDEMPGLLDKMNKYPHASQALGNAMSTAFFEGVKQ